jgi:hypothetical protein
MYLIPHRQRIVDLETSQGSMYAEAVLTVIHISYCPSTTFLIPFIQGSMMIEMDRSNISMMRRWFIELVRHTSNMCFILSIGHVRRMESSVRKLWMSVLVDELTSHYLRDRIVHGGALIPCK